MLYVTSSWLIYFTTGGLYLCIPFTYFANVTPLHYDNHPFFSSYPSLFLFYVCLFLRVPIQVRLYSIFLSLTYFIQQSALQIHPCCHV